MPPLGVPCKPLLGAAMVADGRPWVRLEFVPSEKATRFLIEAFEVARPVNCHRDLDRIVGVADVPMVLSWITSKILGCARKFSGLLGSQEQADFRQSPLANWIVDVHGLIEFGA